MPIEIYGKKFCYCNTIYTISNNKTGRRNQRCQSKKGVVNS